MSQVYQALGIRDPRVNPSIPTGALLPVIVLGSLTAFTSQVIEARSIVNGGPFNILAGQSVVIAMQSVSPGGAIIEHVTAVGPFFLNIGPNQPIVGANVTPFSIGGQQVQNLYQQLLVAGPPPFGTTFSPAAVFPYETTVAGGPVCDDIWVPAGSWFWMTLVGPNGNGQFALRVREIPQAQGPS